MNYLNHQIKNNLALKKIFILIIGMILIELLNIKFNFIHSDYVHLWKLVVLGFALLLSINYYVFLFRGYLRNELMLLYDHFSFFLGSLFPFVLVVLFIFYLQNKEPEIATISNSNIPVFILLFLSLGQLLEGFSFVEINSDSVFIKNGRSKNIFNFKDDEITRITSNENLIITSKVQEVSIKKNIIIEYSKGELERQLNRRVNPKII